MDYVDLIFCHRPDIYTPVEETVWAMNLVIQQGKALYWGTSEWSATRIMEAYGIARREHLIPPLMEQPEYNMFNRERIEKEYACLYQDIGLGTTVYSPLAGGWLSGKYNNGIPKGSRLDLTPYKWLREEFETPQAAQNLIKVKQMMPIANELGCTMAQLALAWCLKNPDVSTAITGASRKEQVIENLRALEVVNQLDASILERIEAILNNKPEPESDWR